MQALLKQLGQITDPENLFTEHADRLAYARPACFPGQPKEAILPLACARPRHMGQVAELLNFCSAENIPVFFRGGGSFFSGNAQAAKPDSLAILTTGLDRIISLDAENRIVRAQPGVSCQKLAFEAAKKGLFYPAMPQAPAIASIGGNLATNAAGKMALKYGNPSNYVISLDIYKANGENLACPAANAWPGAPLQGLPLANLICGSMGALAFIGEGELRLLPLPEHTETRIFHFQERAAKAAAAILASRLLPEIMEIYDPLCAGILADKPGNGQWALELSFCGQKEEALENMREAGRICSEFGGNESGSAFVKDAASLLPALAKQGAKNCEIFAFPAAQAQTFLESAQAICGETGQKIALWGHVGISTIHAAYFGENSGGLAQKLFSLELMLNNAMISEQDAELSRGQWQRNNSALAALSSQLRPLFDPAGILAANKLPGAATL